VTRLGAWARAHPLAAAEVVVALALAALAWSPAPLRLVFGAVLWALGAALRSFVALLADDAGGTLLTALVALVEAALVAAPAARAYRRAPRHRLAWLPLHALVFVLALPMVFAAFSTWTMRVLLVLAATGGWLAAARPRLALLALAPQLLVLEPMLGHSPASELVWTRARLAARCAPGGNEGARVAGFTAELAGNRYFAVTALGDELLVTGERHSFWIGRDGEGGGFARRRPSRVVGNLWEGCRWDDGTLYLAKRGWLFRVGRGPDDVRETRLPDPPGALELDLVDAVCDPGAGKVYVTELLGGGVRVVTPADGRVTRQQGPGGINVQLLRRGDGLLVGVDTARLLVYDPAADRVVAERRAGLSTLGVDLCAGDDAVVVTDIAGRVRLFERDPGGPGYRFVRGRAMAAPRRVAFSPDCARIAVASGDDATVTVLARRDLAVERRFSVGPGLRDLTWADADHVAAADACGVEILAAGAR
jgi:hypothetical protein